MSLNPKQRLPVIFIQELRLETNETYPTFYSLDPSLFMVKLAGVMMSVRLFGVKWHDHSGKLGQWNTTKIGRVFIGSQPRNNNIILHWVWHDFLSYLLTSGNG